MEFLIHNYRQFIQNRFVYDGADAPASETPAAEPSGPEAERETIKSTDEKLALARKQALNSVDRCAEALGDLAAPAHQPHVEALKAQLRTDAKGEFAALQTEWETKKADVVRSGETSPAGQEILTTYRGKAQEFLEKVKARVQEAVQHRISVAALKEAGSGQEKKQERKRILARTQIIENMLRLLKVPDNIHGIARYMAEVMEDEKRDNLSNDVEDVKKWFKDILENTDLIAQAMQRMAKDVPRIEATEGEMRTFRVYLRDKTFFPEYGAGGLAQIFGDQYTENAARALALRFYTVQIGEGPSAPWYYVDLMETNFPVYDGAALKAKIKEIVEKEMSTSSAVQKQLETARVLKTELDAAVKRVADTGSWGGFWNDMIDTLGELKGEDTDKLKDLALLLGRTQTLDAAIATKTQQVALAPATAAAAATPAPEAPATAAAAAPAETPATPIEASAAAPADQPETPDPARDKLVAVLKNKWPNVFTLTALNDPQSPINTAINQILSNLLQRNPSRVQLLESGGEFIPSPAELQMIINEVQKANGWDALDRVNEDEVALITAFRGTGETQTFAERMGTASDAIAGILSRLYVIKQGENGAIVLNDGTQDYVVTKIDELKDRLPLENYESFATILNPMTAADALTAAQAALRTSAETQQEGMDKVQKIKEALKKNGKDIFGKMGITEVIAALMQLWEAVKNAFENKDYDTLKDVLDDLTQKRNPAEVMKNNKAAFEQIMNQGRQYGTEVGGINTILQAYVNPRGDEANEIFGETNAKNAGIDNTPENPTALADLARYRSLIKPVLQKYLAAGFGLQKITEIKKDPDSDVITITGVKGADKYELEFANGVITVFKMDERFKPGSTTEKETVRGAQKGDPIPDVTLSKVKECVNLPPPPPPSSPPS